MVPLRWRVHTHPPKGNQARSSGALKHRGPAAPRAYFFWTRAVSVASKSMSPFPVASLPISVMLRGFPTNMPGFAASAASMSSHQVPVVVQVIEEGAVIVGQLTCAMSGSGTLLNFGSTTMPLIIGQIWSTRGPAELPMPVSIASIATTVFLFPLMIVPVSRDALPPPRAGRVTLLADTKTEFTPGDVVPAAHAS